MSKLGLLCFIILNLTYCQNKNKSCNCSLIKTGKFQYFNKSIHCWYVIDRNDSVQTETNACSGNSLIKRVRWINDCRYELADISGSKIDTLNDGRVIKYSRKSDTQLIRVIEAEKTFYVFETVISTGKTVTDTIWMNKIGGFKAIGETFGEK